MSFFKNLFSKSSSNTPNGAQSSLEEELRYWKIFEIENNDIGRMVVRARLEKPELVSLERYKVAVEIIWQYESDDGMPDDETNANISRFEELLDDLSCENDFSYLIQVSTGMGEKRWLYYSIDLDRFTREFNLMVEDKLTFPITVEASDDPDWKIWSDFIETVTAES